MRVHDLIAQHSIPWPPPVATSVRPFENLPVASEVRQAILESVFWREDDAPPWIHLNLQFHGRMVTTSLVCRPEQQKVYQDLFWALHRGLGRTLAEVEDLEVAL
jgi:hypothetical protein